MDLTQEPSGSLGGKQPDHPGAWCRWSVLLLQPASSCALGSLELSPSRRVTSLLWSQPFLSPRGFITILRPGNIKKKKKKKKSSVAWRRGRGAQTFTHTHHTHTHARTLTGSDATVRPRSKELDRHLNTAFALWVLFCFFSVGMWSPLGWVTSGYSQGEAEWNTRYKYITTVLY